MSTLQTPGIFDCLKKLHPGEPYFVLRAQDSTAATLVRIWAARAEEEGCNPGKVAEARELAKAMEAWPQRKLPD